MEHKKILLLLLNLNKDGLETTNFVQNNTSVLPVFFLNFKLGNFILFFLFQTTIRNIQFGLSRLAVVELLC